MLCTLVLAAALSAAGFSGDPPGQSEGSAGSSEAPAIVLADPPPVSSVTAEQMSHVRFGANGEIGSDLKLCQEVKVVPPFGVLPPTTMRMHYCSNQPAILLTSGSHRSCGTSFGCVGVGLSGCGGSSGGGHSGGCR